MIALNEVIIVVPVYREKLLASEQIALKQLYSVLGKYPICFMAPKKMEPFFSERNLYAEFFPDEDLAGRLPYSKLLLKPEFYERFLSYKYILIYQLDAFVFYDKLDYFCNQEYDYWGAPMPITYWKNVFTRVGNGGFSLRKVSSCIRVTQMRQAIYDKTGIQAELEASEDEFFAYCGKDKDINFTVPSSKLAAQFSVEFNVAHSWDKLSVENLPFGCHAWSKPQYLSLWKPILENFVELSLLEKVELEFDKKQHISYRNLEWNRVSILLFERLLREQNDKVKMILDEVLPQYAKYIIWGNGLVANRAKQLFKEYGRTIEYIFDIRAEEKKVNDSENRVVKPQKTIVGKDNIVIIATTKYSGEIKKQLQEWGIEEGKGFWEYAQIEKKLLTKYYVPLWDRMCTK